MATLHADRDQGRPELPLEDDLSCNLKIIIIVIIIILLIFLKIIIVIVILVLIMIITVIMLLEDDLSCSLMIIIVVIIVPQMLTFYMYSDKFAVYFSWLNGMYYLLA